MQQSALVAGDTLNFLTTVADYLAADGWTLRYRLIPRTNGGAALTLTSAAEGTDHRVQVAAATTATWGADDYSWSSWVEKAGESYSLEAGQLRILADPRTVAAGYDSRTPARKALDAADAALSTYGAKAWLQAYAINGRSQTFRSPDDFMSWRSKLQMEVSREAAASDLAAGQRPRNKILVRLPRA